MNRFGTVMTILFCGMSAACGRNDGPPRGTVEGKVTLNGEPVENGEITFSPTLPTTGPATYGRIESGRYYLDTNRNGPVVGNHRVEIRWRRLTDEKDDQGLRIAKEAIPGKYNTESTLSAIVKPSKQTADFDLTTN